MFAEIKTGIQLVRTSLIVFRKHPILLIPLMICWGMYAPAIVYLNFFFKWDNINIGSRLFVLMMAIVFFSFVLSLSCFILLGMLDQIEMGRKLNLFDASLSAFRNVLIALPIVLVWAFIWFIITLIAVLFRALFSSMEDDNAGTQFNAENVARTLSGIEKISFSGSITSLINKGIRMISYIIYPAIAWEKHGIIYAIKRGLMVAKIHKGEFLIGFVITELAVVTVFTPPSILFFLAKHFHIHFPDVVWFLTIVYCCFAWSFSAFLEQMFVAELYRWHLLWEKSLIEAQRSGHKLPEFQDVRRPCILDNANLAITGVRAEKEMRGTDRNG